MEKSFFLLASSTQAWRNIFETTENLHQMVKKHRDILRDLLNKFSKATGTLSQYPSGSAGPATAHHKAM